ncbi:MAG: leucyl/phenylalanyl-tRNA--protein transferase [Candidatus Puniceispirillum sp.]
MANSQRYSYAPETIIKAYALGVFPMADSHDSREIHFYDPDQRALIPLDRHTGAGPHIPRRLQRRVRQTPFRVTINVDFAAVISACAAPSPTRTDTWINQDIKQLYIALHKMGFAHSIEVWDGAVLVGGLYGVALRAAFFGESMFSRQTDASKIALVHLMARLHAGRFHFLDAQFSNDHLQQFGVTEVPRHEFQSRLAAALAADADLQLATSSQSMATAFLDALNTGKI